MGIYVLGNIGKTNKDQVQNDWIVHGTPLAVSVIVSFTSQVWC